MSTLMASTSQLVPADDWGLLYGYGLFETIRSYQGVPFQLDAHVDRMLASARALRFTAVPQRADIVSRTAECARSIGDGVVRVTLTRGNDAHARAPQLLLTTRSVTYTDDQYAKGIALKWASSRRDRHGLVAGHKTLNQLQNIVEWGIAAEGGYDECLFIDSDGGLAEGSRSNVFLVQQQAVSTPEANGGILPGLTRQLVIEILRDLKYPVVERAIGAHELMGATECFVTNSVMGIMPVARIESHRFTRSADGVARAVRAEYERRVHASVERESVGGCR